MKINPKVFLDAAKLQAQFVDGEASILNVISRYSCDNIGTVCFSKKYGFAEGPYLDLYAEYFQSEDRYFGWWDGDDNESRILALLLMHEIAKDLNKKSKSKKR